MLKIALCPPPAPLFQRGLSVLLAASLLSTSLLAGCAQGPLSTQAGRIGYDDGTDSCRRQVVALDSTGNFFAADILAGAAMGAVAGGLAGGLISRDWRGALIGAGTGAVLGGATGYWGALQRQQQDQAAMFAQVQGDLSRENAQIDRTQLAFDQVMDCRFSVAAQIRADQQAGRIDRATAVNTMAVLHQRAQRDLALATQINGQIAGRGDQFDVAAENLRPGTKAAIAAPRPRQTTLRQAAQLRLRPDPSAPPIGQVKASQPVTVTGSRGGYALVETANGERGYAPVEALSGGRAAAPSRIAADDGDIRSLASSNAARRDDFAASLSVSQAAVSSGFEVAG
jgi:hypothetical protein